MSLEIVFAREKNIHEFSFQTERTFAKSVVSCGHFAMQAKETEMRFQLECAKLYKNTIIAETKGQNAKKCH